MIINKNLVTNKEYKLFKPNHLFDDNNPVTDITWCEADEYAKSQGCRLPTEQEWLNMPDNCFTYNYWEWTFTETGSNPVIYSRDVLQNSITICRNYLDPSNRINDIGFRLVFDKEKSKDLSIEELKQLLQQKSNKNQIIFCTIEEMSEATKVLTKFLRNNSKFSIENLTEEIAHAMLMLDATRDIFGITEDNIIKYQISALKKFQEGIKRMQNK